MKHCLAIDIGASFGRHIAVVGESKNGKSLYFKGEYKTLFERYSV